MCAQPPTKGLSHDQSRSVSFDHALSPGRPGSERRARLSSVSAAAKLVGVSASKARALLALDDEPATTAAQNQSESADAASEVDSTDVENQPPSTGSPSSDESESVGADAQPEPALSH